MKDRIKHLRTKLNLTQAQFGKKLGVGRGVIVNLELGRARPRQLLIGHMCELFGVNEHWLYTGEGEMFRDTDEAALELLSRKYALNDEDRAVIRAYVKLGADKRAALGDMLRNLAEITAKEG